MPAVALVHIEDPRVAIVNNAGDLSAIEVYNNQVLVGLYKRPTDIKTKGGVMLPDAVVKEDHWQTKVGLVLKTGPQAFTDTSGSGFWFHDHEGTPRHPVVGDWVVFRHSDGWSVTLLNNGRRQDCRVFDDISIRMKITDPDMVY